MCREVSFHVALRHPASEGFCIRYAEAAATYSDAHRANGCVKPSMAKDRADEIAEEGESDAGE
jgi:hypothetical protein